MVKPNIVIYPLPFITREKLQSFSSKLKQLEAQTETAIVYNYDEQFFSIEGETQDGCDIAEKTITLSLIPLLSKSIDKNCMIGTYEDLSYFKEITPAAPLNIVNVTGRVLGDHNEDLDDNEEVRIIADPENVQFIIKEFIISPSITNVSAFLIGPPQFNMQLANYIEIVPRMTNTDCVLLGRCIRITGEEHCVDEAINKFRVIQNSHIAHLEVDHAVCIHYPHITGHYGLCFCGLDRYRHNSFVIDQLEPQQRLEKLHVLLPAFLDPVLHEYIKPKDLIQLKPPVQKNNHTMIEEEFKERDKLKQKELDDAFAMLNVKPNDLPVTSFPTAIPKNKREYNITTNNISTSNIPLNTNYREEMHLEPLQSTTSIKPTNVKKTSTQRMARGIMLSKPDDEGPQSVYEYKIPVLPENDEDNFPELSPSPTPRSRTPINGRQAKGLFKPTLGADKPKQNRVLRIVPQKSSSPRTPRPALSLVDRVKEFNYYNIKNVLEKGLDSLRGFKGEIKLSAKIGKVIWNNVPDDVKGQIWKYEDINDIILKEHHLKPVFTNVTTRDEYILGCMTSESILPTPAYNITSTYEFHCSARNQPSLPFRPVTVHMNQGIINVKKVVLRDRVTSKIDWISLDRKYDFQFSLSTQVLARTDVKPYSTFIKRVSICPITRLMTFENVPKFLSVNYILLKETARFRIESPLIIEITRVEKVPIKPVANTVKINAYPGDGEIWYDFEIRNTKNDRTFEKNKGLEIGEEAPWTAKDILGLTDEDHGKADNITKYVKNILSVIEKIEREIQG